jgi:hypothetical protein
MSLFAELKRRAYAYFDPRPFPNLMALLESQDVEPREPREIPYRCKL